MQWDERADSLAGCWTHLERRAAGYSRGCVDSWQVVAHLPRRVGVFGQDEVSEAQGAVLVERRVVLLGRGVVDLRQRVDGFSQCAVDFLQRVDGFSQCAVDFSEDTLMIPNHWRFARNPSDLSRLDDWHFVSYVSAAFGARLPCSSKSQNQ